MGVNILIIKINCLILYYNLFLLISKIPIYSKRNILIQYTYGKKLLYIKISNFS